MRIEYVTHASLLLKSNGLSFLTDPFFFPELDPVTAPCIRNFPPREIVPADFGRIDFLFSSHEHDDHCQRESLAALKDQVETAVIPAERPDLEARYRNLGFKRICLLENRKPVVLAEGLEVTSYWDDPVDSMLLVKMGGKLVLHANDCLPSLPTLARMGREHQVDYAFMGSTSAQQVYPLFLDRSEEELEALAKERELAFFEEQFLRISALRPRVVVPYSYTITYVQPDQLRLNGYARMTPSLFADAFRARGSETECWVLQPGDVIDSNTDTVQRIRDENLWGSDLPEFLRNIKRYSESIQATLPSLDPEEPECCDVQLREHLERLVSAGERAPKLFSFFNDAVVLRTVGTTRTTSYLVDLGRRSVSVASERKGEGAEPLLEISIPASLARALLDGSHDWQTVLATYRVSLTPHPDIARLRFTPVDLHALYLGAFAALFVGADATVLEGLHRLSEYLRIRRRSMAAELARADLA